MIEDALVDQTISGATTLIKFERCGYSCVDYDTTTHKVYSYYLSKMEVDYCDE